MEFRGRELLSAEARFLADFCGEDAVRRWHARLSDSERDQLGYSVAFVQEICRSVAEAMWHLLQQTVESLSDAVRSFVKTFVALITGQFSGLIGRKTP